MFSTAFKKLFGSKVGRVTILPPTWRVGNDVTNNPKAWNIGNIQTEKKIVVLYSEMLLWYYHSPRKTLW